MTTPKIKSVEETYHTYFKRDESVTVSGTPDVETNKKIIIKALTQDRHSLHTSLVAAVEGLDMGEKYSVSNDASTEYISGAFHGYDKAKIDTLTIINSIFKE